MRNISKVLLIVTLFLPMACGDDDDSGSYDDNYTTPTVDTSDYVEEGDAVSGQVNVRIDANAPGVQVAPVTVGVTHCILAVEEAYEGVTIDLECPEFLQETP